MNSQFSFLAAELHMLAVIESMKVQQAQMAVGLQQVRSLVELGGHTSVPEMPEELRFPITDLNVLDEVEVWLKHDNNRALKKNVVS